MKKSETAKTPKSNSKEEKSVKSKKATAEDKVKLEQLEQALEKEKENFLRLFAEFENYKKRTAKERIELFKTANQEVMTAMIPVLDDIQRAKQQMDKANQVKDFEGFKLIFNKFSDILRNNGLQPITTQIGDVFNAEIHEAITQIPAPNTADKGKIMDIIEIGYQLGERIIRYPKVVVGQ